jgi:hypothetical protein
MWVAGGPAAGKGDAARRARAQLEPWVSGVAASTEAPTIGAIAAAVWTGRPHSALGWGRPSPRRMPRLQDAGGGEAGALVAGQRLGRLRAA